MSAQLVEIFKEIVNKVSNRKTADLKDVNPLIEGVHYDHGHYVEINTTLQNKENSKVFFGKKYPLVALFEDIVEKDLGKGLMEANLNLVICFYTAQDDKSEDRYRKVINPILEPIYQEFIKSVKSHRNLRGYSFPHTKINRPFWGVSGRYGNRANLFSDTLDAIEIQNLKVRYVKDNC